MSVHTQMTTIAGVETFVARSGEGDRPVICVHGNPDSGEAWAALLARGDELGGVIVPDLPGFGRSERPDHACSTAPSTPTTGGSKASWTR